MQNDKVHPSKNDKTIGWILTTIGIIGVMYAVQTSYSAYSASLNPAIGQLIVGTLIRSLIPLLFISSGQYYLSGKNAAKKAKKQASN